MHIPQADWTNMKTTTRIFLLIMGILLMLGVQGGIETAEDWIDWFWVVTVFVGAVCTLLVAIRIDKITE
jgi:hypothetical protein